MPKTDTTKFKKRSLSKRIVKKLSRYTLILFVIIITIVGILPDAIVSYSSDAQEDVGYKIFYVILAGFNMALLFTFQIAFVIVLIYKRHTFTNFHMLRVFADMVASTTFCYGMLYSAILRFNQAAFLNARTGWVLMEYLQMLNMAFGISGTMGSTLEANVFYTDIVVIFQKFTTISNFLIVSSLVWTPFVHNKTSKLDNQKSK